MVLVFGYCQGNSRECVRVYTDRFPNRRIPSHPTFAAVERRLRETGQFAPSTVDCGRHRFVRVVEVEEEILERFEEDPEISTRRLGREIGLSKDVVHGVLKEELLYPYHKTPVQDLLQHDPNMRLVFCRFFNRQRERDLNFGNNILFTDEACFTRKGVTNFHNEHVYADENPHAIKVKHFQHEFKINVWAGIISNHIVGPVIFPQRLTGEIYLQYLQNSLPNLLENLPLQLRRDMWLMHDEAPPHFALNVRNHLNQQYPNKWIGRGNDAPVKWPPRSPDLNPMDYFLWGHLKSMVYMTTVDNEEQLCQRIQDAINNIRNDEEVMQRVHFNFLRHINLCIRANDGLFEQFL
ncbi:uncharacterized protein [Euwallacea fornicatus]|uniref:uncharacterized protein n=1 Tax=Euwallacea fornicatus TaxID=995702 RepID=UPI00338FC54C